MGRYLLVAVAAAVLLTGCGGGSASAPKTAPTVSLKAQVREMYAQMDQRHDFDNPSLTAAKYDGFAASVQGLHVSGGDVGMQAEIVSAAHAVAAAFRGYQAPNVFSASASTLGKGFFKITSSEGALRQLVMSL